MVNRKLEGAINKNGRLCIKRKGSDIVIVTYCMYDVSAQVTRYCGSHCAHFSEPYSFLVDPIKGKEESRVTVVELCHGKKLTFTTFEDFR